MPATLAGITSKQNEEKRKPSGNQGTVHQNEWETETETRPVILSWIVTVDTQVSCRKIPKISPSSKRAFEKYKTPGLFSEF